MYRNVLQCTPNGLSTLASASLVNYNTKVDKMGPILTHKFSVWIKEPRSCDHKIRHKNALHFEMPEPRGQSFYKLFYNHF